MFLFLKHRLMSFNKAASELRIALYNKGMWTLKLPVIQYQKTDQAIENMHPKISILFHIKYTISYKPAKGVFLAETGLFNMCSVIKK